MDYLEIDLGPLLKNLQTLNFEEADLLTLAEYQNTLDVIQSTVTMVLNLPESVRSAAKECLSYYGKIQQEFYRRGINTSVDEICANPELMIIVLQSLPVIDLILVEGRLKQALADDPDLQPVYDFVLEILKIKVADLPCC